MNTSVSFTKLHYCLVLLFSCSFELGYPAEVNEVDKEALSRSFRVDNLLRTAIETGDYTPMAPYINTTLYYELKHHTRPLHEVVLLGCISCVDKCLALEGIDLDATDSEGRPALVISTACAIECRDSGDHEREERYNTIVCKLLRAGASTEVVTNYFNRQIQDDLHAISRISRPLSKL